MRDDKGHWRRLTIEVRPAVRQIVQARGRFNAKAEPRDLLALEAWASRNRLSIALGRWQPVSAANEDARRRRECLRGRRRPAAPPL
jgi:hypothetical protein